jgi:hypothetical protein
VASAARSTDSSLAAKSCSSCVFGVSRGIVLGDFSGDNIRPFSSCVRA